MQGRAEIVRLQQKLDVTFSRVGALDAESEVQSDFAKYLCVIVSGFVETAVKEILQEHSRNNGSPTLQKFTEHRLRRTTNLNSEKMEKLLTSFDENWSKDFLGSLNDEKKDALNSVISLRNQISHGESVGLTFHRMSNYYESIKMIVADVVDICDPK